MLLLFISLITKDVGCLFICLSKMTFKEKFVFFSIRLFGFFLLIHGSSLYMLDINSLLVVYVLNIVFFLTFHLTLHYLLNHFMVSFGELNSLILMFKFLFFFLLFMVSIYNMLFGNPSKP